MERESFEQSTNKRWLWIILGIAILCGCGYWYFFGGEKNRLQPITDDVDRLKTPPSIVDTSSVPITNSTKIVPESSGEEGIYFERYQIIEQGAIGVEESTGSTFAQAFGTLVFKDPERSTSQETWAYLIEPQVGKPYPTAYRFNEKELVPTYQFEDYKKNFSLSPFNIIPTSYKQLILQNNRYNGNDYTITQNAERAQSTYCTGDFDNDGIQDIAVILDNNEKQYSRLLILSYNEKTELPYVAFSENYSDKMRINAFKKGAKIYMSEISNGFSPAPTDGIILRGEDIKLALVYDMNLQKFKSYFQE